ncbi:GNAT family N-acetyltransferase [Aureispira anguillae]|uniref:GNAT family N-acetyltransferase n=1 Tax=Aureispira anguillae TaxID=2864201 RepID=A0A915YF45_9BACT|nr:GNAT family N-acetyltransferase [Aureispira anguillae]BDS11851.1 GNAT family N-acetyltransferase [Aureispira anguillae]
MKKYISYETERLILKPTTKEDAPFILRLLNTPKWIQNIGDRSVRSLKDAEYYIQEKITPQLDRLGYSNYTMIRKTDGCKVGSCGLYSREGLEGIDIGFALFPEFEKQGYAFEGAQKIMQLAIHEFGLKQISGITIKENIASQRLLEKLGLKFSRTVILPNSQEELLLYQLIL